MDKEAEREFERFYRQASPRVLALAAQMLSDQSEAEDIMIETFARAYARWPKLGRQSWRDGWVLRVAANLSLDHLRRRRPVLQPEVIVPDSVPDPGQGVVNRSIVAQALARLSRRQQQVVVLSHYGGMSEQEIADVLDISLGSVKSHRLRALAGMRTSLGTDHE